MDDNFTQDFQKEINRHFNPGNLTKLLLVPTSAIRVTNSIHKFCDERGKRINPIDRFISYSLSTSVELGKAVIYGQLAYMGLDIIT